MLPYRSQLDGADNNETPQRLVGGYCRQHNVAFGAITFSNTGLLPNNAIDKLYLFADEIHFSAEGHKMVAHYILSH